MFEIFYHSLLCYLLRAHFPILLFACAYISLCCILTLDATKNSWSGYSHKLEYDPEDAATRKRKNRPRSNIIQYNPPLSKSAETNIGKKFLTLTEKCFPRGNALRKIFNKNTVKICYSFVSNVKQIINKHNKKQVQVNNSDPEKRPKPKHATAEKRKNVP